MNEIKNLLGYFDPYQQMRRELSRDAGQENGDYILYHATSPENAAQVMSQGFRSGVYLGVDTEVCGTMATDWGAILKVRVPKRYLRGKDWSYNCLTKEVYIDQPIPPELIEEVEGWRG